MSWIDGRTDLWILSINSGGAAVRDNLVGTTFLAETAGVDN
jgi:hypothetical protein